MNRIDSINSNPKQSLTLVLEDGSKFSFSMEYVENQRGWFYTLVYGEFILYNRRIVASPNMLRQFRNIIPFGIACTTQDRYEPIFIDDFSKDRATMYILNEEDVVSVEEFLVNVG